ncbi:hypothetical protein V494_01131 [Pseudogymnoascus sp. VKM F-4513 (FW-928)]|nr:hypothetical protein V494_01131 [Pseudogymnoascus sp. VKM F-4513 (FW-928)]
MSHNPTPNIHPSPKAREETTLCCVEPVRLRHYTTAARLTETQRNATEPTEALKHVQAAFNGTIGDDKHVQLT